MVGIINPNLAFKLGEGWSAAIGFDWARADMRELSRNIFIPAGPCGATPCEGFAKLTGDGTDTGWNAAVRWAGKRAWRWGASYRSRMKPDIDGNIDFQVPAAAIAALFPDGGASAVIPLPASFVTGIAYAPKGNWEGEFDILWTGWSVFDHLRIDIANNTAAVTDVDQTEEWKDTYSFRFGLTYYVNDRHLYRFGAYYDKNPIPDAHVRPRLPDADRTSLQAGYGFRSKSGFTFDVAYQALFFKDRTATGSPLGPLGPGTGSDPVQPGTYQNFTNLLGVSVGWTFGK